MTANEISPQRVYAIRKHMAADSKVRLLEVRRDLNSSRSTLASRSIMKAISKV